MRLLPHPRHLLCPSVRVSTKTWWCWTLMSTTLHYLLAWPAAWPATIPSTKHRSISLTATRRLSPRPSFVSSKISSGKHLHFLFGGFEIERGTERGGVHSMFTLSRSFPLTLYRLISKTHGRSKALKLHLTTVTSPAFTFKVLRVAWLIKTVDIPFTWLFNLSLLVERPFVWTE